MTIRVHDLGESILCDGLVQRFDAEVGMHRIRQPPTQHLARCPIHDGHRVEEAVIDRHEGDIGAPNLIGTVDLQLSQQIREDPMIQYPNLGRSAYLFQGLGSKLRRKRLANEISFAKSLG